MGNYISPEDLAPASATRTFEEDVALFGRQINGWLFQHVRALSASSYASAEQAGFAVLMLIVSYFEAIEGYRRGRTGKSVQFFIAGLQWVLPELKSVSDAALGELYNQLRCGLYHQAAPKGQVSIAHARKPVRIELSPSSKLVHAVIDPWLLFAAIERHFVSYTTDLLNPSQATLRSAFEKFRALRRAEVTAPSFSPGGARSTWP